MTLGQRLRKIEGILANSRGGRQRPTICIVYDSDMPTEAQRKTAIAECKTINPECSDNNNIHIIYVLDEKTKKLTERVLSGERTD